MTASKQEIRVAAKERHPNAVNIRMEAKEDYNIPGIADEEHPGIRVIVTADGREYVYEADTRDELLAKLLEKGKSATKDIMTDRRAKALQLLAEIDRMVTQARDTLTDPMDDETLRALLAVLSDLHDATARVKKLLEGKKP